MRTPPIPDERIFAVIADGAHLTGEIAEALGRSRSSLYKRLRRMVDARKLRYVDQSVHYRGGYYLTDQASIRRTEGPIIVLDAIAAGCHTWAAIRERTNSSGITHHVNALIRQGLIKRHDSKLYLCNGRPVPVKPAKAKRAGPVPVYERSGNYYHDGFEAMVEEAGMARRERLIRVFANYAK